MIKNYHKILLISEAHVKPKKLYVDQIPKLAKGLIRLGHDVSHLSYTGIMAQLSPFKSRTINHRLYKIKTDNAICEYAKHFRPDIVFIGFSRGLDKHTVQALRTTLPTAIFFGWDGDPSPCNNPGRIELACELDVLFATNNGEFLDEYKKQGVKKCLFMPNLIDPDNDHRYQIGKQWQSDILWTGKIQHQVGVDAGETVRQNVLSKFSGRPGAKIYGCLGYSEISGIDYLYAISGAQIGISINAINTVPLYHSDRFTHYSACGTMVLAKRVPDTDLLMEDKKHVRYFDTEEECLELADWYLKHEKERQTIADTGNKHCSANYNSVQMAGYIVDAIETGQYTAPWGTFS